MRYDIWRFYFDKPKKFVKTVASLQEAQEHCQSDATHAPGKWFDGYEVHSRESFEARYYATGDRE